MGRASPWCGALNLGSAEEVFHSLAAADTVTPAAVGCMASRPVAADTVTPVAVGRATPAVAVGCRVSLVVGIAAEVGTVAVGDIPVVEAFQVVAAGSLGFEEGIALVADTAAAAGVSILLAAVGNPVAACPVAVVVDTLGFEEGTAEAVAAGSRLVVAVGIPLVAAAGSLPVVEGIVLVVAFPAPVVGTAAAAARSPAEAEAAAAGSPAGAAAGPAVVAEAGYSG